MNKAWTSERGIQLSIQFMRTSKNLTKHKANKIESQKISWNVFRYRSLQEYENKNLPLESNKEYIISYAIKILFYKYYNIKIKKK